MHTPLNAGLILHRSDFALRTDDTIDGVVRRGAADNFHDHALFLSRGRRDVGISLYPFSRSVVRANFAVVATLQH